MKFFIGGSWYEVQVQVTGVNGFGTTYRGAMNGTLRECRTYTQELDADGIGYRVVRTKVVLEKAGSKGHDYLKHLFIKQGLRLAARTLDELADADDE